MNEKFIAAVKKAGITGYKLSKKTGIPYTTISELLTGKKDINKKAAETVLRLAEWTAFPVNAAVSVTSGKEMMTIWCWKRYLRKRSE